MANLTTTYYRLVKSGKLTIEDVPEKYREAVKRMLENEE